VEKREYYKRPSVYDASGQYQKRRGEKRMEGGDRRYNTNKGDLGGREKRSKERNLDETKG